MDLPVYFAFKDQVGGLQAKLEREQMSSTVRLVLSGGDGSFIKRSQVTWMSRDVGTRVKRDTISKDTNTSESGTF